MYYIGAILFFIVSIRSISNEFSVHDYLFNNHEHSEYCYTSSYRDDYYNDARNNNLKEYKMDCEQAKYGNAFSYSLCWYFRYGFWVSLLYLVAPSALGGLIYLWLHSYELTVTDKRIYGKVAFGKRVDLPVDSISATATVRLFKGVSVSTASGKISFLVIKNADEIYTVINNLLIERQQEKNRVTIAPVENETDKLKKYKDLLDSGVITQQEFDAKKKQLLGL